MVLLHVAQWSSLCFVSVPQKPQLFLVCFAEHSVACKNATQANIQHTIAFVIVLATSFHGVVLGVGVEGGWKSYSKVAPSLSLSCTFPVFSGSTCSIQDVPASPEVSGVEFHMGSRDPGQTDRKNTFPNSMFGLVAITGTGSLVAPVLENQNGAME